jgi:hypothetical protein
MSRSGPSTPPAAAATGGYSGSHRSGSGAGGFTPVGASQPLPAGSAPSSRVSRQSSSAQLPGAALTTVHHAAAGGTATPRSGTPRENIEASRGGAALASATAGVASNNYAAQFAAQYAGTAAPFMASAAAAVTVATEAAAADAAARRALAALEERVFDERLRRDVSERRLLLHEERCAAERIEDDEAHRRRLLEMFVAAGVLRDDRREAQRRERAAIEALARPAVVEQLDRVGQHVAVERSIVDALRRQLEARTAAGRAAAAKEREKVGFYRTMLIRRLRQLEDHVRFVCGADHWLLRMPDLADNATPFMTASGLRLQPSAATGAALARGAASATAAGATPSLIMSQNVATGAHLTPAEAESAARFAKMLVAAAASPPPAAETVSAAAAT